MYVLFFAEQLMFDKSLIFSAPCSHQQKVIVM